MKLHNTFKIIWWVLLLVGLFILIYNRFTYIVTDQVLPFDYIIFTVFIVLACLPFFSEMNMFGFKLKKEIEEVKENVDSGINELRNLITNNNNSNSIYFTPFANPLSPKQLEELEHKLNVEEEKSPLPPETITDKYLKNEYVKPLFAIRYAVEQEFVRIYENRTGENTIKKKRLTPVLKIIRELLNEGAIDNNLAEGLKEVWVITSGAIHGEDIAKKQVNFVLATGPKLIEELKNLI
ncbi:hypothetical protein [Priestia megaterium]|uniref:hypothetical protein n=1 Tax=Priestia megaterium TaxID=1404 RepID=UPI0012B7D4B7|nr:hypothetical protein [Priestia megaterium]